MRIGKALVTALLLVAVGACGPLGTEEPALQMQEQALEVQPQAGEVQPKEVNLAAAEAKWKAVIEERLAGVEARTEENPCSQVQLFVSNFPISVCISPARWMQR